jgi:hypothetical protein
MKSKIVYSIFILFVFLSGLGLGVYGGISLGTSPASYQLWAGAKEMQGAISYIDQRKVDKARSLLCNSIKSRLVIMDLTHPIKSGSFVSNFKELEKYVYNPKDKQELTAVCI